MDFTAVAMETNFTEAVNINEYVLGRVEEPERWEHNWFTGSIGNDRTGRLRPLDRHRRGDIVQRHTDEGAVTP